MKIVWTKLGYIDNQIKLSSLIMKKVTGKKIMNPTILSPRLWKYFSSHGHNGFLERFAILLILIKQMALILLEESILERNFQDCFSLWVELGRLVDFLNLHILTRFGKNVYIVKSTLSIHFAVSIFCIFMFLMSLFSYHYFYCH